MIHNVVDDSTYFSFYSQLSVHKEMLNDSVRTEQYRNAIFQCVKDAVVLDVGCGTGILSMFCAAAGAKKVYAIEASDMADVASRIVANNGFDSVIRVIKGQVEHVQIEEQVDVIVSEWMGYCLFYEGMLRSVLIARDRYLRPGGLMIPKSASLYVALVEGEEWHKQEIGYWKNVHGFDMTALQPYAARSFFAPVAKVQAIKPQYVVSNITKVCTIDCLNVKLTELSRDDFCRGTFRLRAERTTSKVYGLGCWFDVALADNVLISTSPFAPKTHWEQTLFTFPDFVTIEEGQEVDGSIEITMLEYPNHRHINVRLSIPAIGLNKLYAY